MPILLFVSANQSKRLSISHSNTVNLIKAMLKVEPKLMPVSSFSLQLVSKTDRKRKLVVLIRCFSYYLRGLVELHSIIKQDNTLKAQNGMSCIYSFAVVFFLDKIQWRVIHKL